MRGSSALRRPRLGSTTELGTTIGTATGAASGVFSRSASSDAGWGRERPIGSAPDGSLTQDDGVAADELPQDTRR